MATTEFIAAIELGSSKITGVAGKKNSDGSMQVLAYAQEDSSTFIRKGVIFNLDKTAQSLTSIINRLEGELKNSIAKVYVGIGGQSLRTVRNVVSRDLEEEAIISEELVSAIGDENIAIPVVDMDILDVAPQEYKVGNNLQANPVGLVGSHIEGRYAVFNEGLDDPRRRIGLHRVEDVAFEIFLEPARRYRHRVRSRNGDRAFRWPLTDQVQGRMVRAQFT